MSIRLRLIALVLIGLLAAVVTAYWFHVAGELRKGIDTFTTQRRAAGWRVEMDSVAMGGFPRAVTARLSGVDLRSPAGLSWHGDAITITIPLLNPLEVTVDLAGQHILAGLGWSGILSAGRAQTRLRLHPDGELAGFAFTGSTLALEQSGVDPLTLDGVSIAFDHFNPPDASHRIPSAGVTLALSGLDLPDIPGLPLARRIDSFQVDAKVMGTIESGPPLAALAAWSNDGGVIALDRVALDWKPLSLEADGTLALDPQLQPRIDTSARIRGLGEFMVRLVQAGLVEPKMASTAQIVLAILARPDPQGRPTLSVPLILQNGILTAGQIRVMTVPRLPIPAPSP